MANLSVDTSSRRKSCRKPRKTHALPIVGKVGEGGKVTFTPEIAAAIRACRDLTGLRPATDDEIARAHPITMKPNYPPASILEIGRIPQPENPLYGCYVTGWCMWPNLWDGDFAVVRRLSDGLRLAAGRDLEKEPLTGSELFQFMHLNNRIIHVGVSDKPSMVKRLRIDASRRWPRIWLCCDNQRMYNSIQIDSADIAATEKAPRCGLQVCGVVEMVAPMNRDPKRLPEQIADEYSRVYDDIGVRRDGGR